jgi:hypothetical protein
MSQYILSIRIILKSDEYLTLFIYLFIFAVLGTEPRALHILSALYLGKCSTTEISSPQGAPSDGPYQCLLPTTSPLSYPGKLRKYDSARKWTLSFCKGEGVMVWR